MPGITGYSDMETAASVAKAAVEAPRWSEGDIQAFDGLAVPAHRREPAGGGTPLVSDVSRQHLLRPARRGDAGDLGDRHRPVGHHGQGLRAAGPRAARRQVARHRARLRQHAVPPDAAGDARGGHAATSTRASPPSSSAGACSARTRRSTCSWWRPPARRSGRIATCSWTPAGSSSARPSRRFRLIRAIEPFTSVLRRGDPAPRGLRRLPSRVGGGRHADRVRRAGGDRVGLPRAHRARARGRPAAGPHALRRLHGRAQDRPHGGDGQRSRDPALVVVGPADRCVAAPQRLPAAGRVRRVQHVAGPAQPRAWSASRSGSSMASSRVPTAPGLGVDVDEETIDEYRIA